VRFSPSLLLPVSFKLMKTLSLCAVTMATLAMGVSSIASAQIAYLGPAGSWTHQACMDLFGDTNLVALDRQALFKALRAKTVAKACVPATTSVVGATPYLDDVLALDTVHVVGEYPKALGYSLLAKPGTRKEDIRTVLAHPVALEEVKPWLDREMPNVERQPAASGGAAAKSVAEGAASGMAAMGPPGAARLYGLAPIVSGIEEGPHNTTRWWVLGHAMPAPSGHDKTTLLLTVDEEGFQRSLQALAQSARVLAVYERPGKRSLDGHRYVIDVVGHASQPEIARLLADRAEFRLLGSYPRRY
jgi:prephenate dehydratase